MKILSIDTSCDETSVAITEGRKVLSHIEYSQILTHKEWGGVVPSLAKRAHEERIEWVVLHTLQRAFGKSKNTLDTAIQEVDAIAVTYGPGLAIALEVGINTAKNLSVHYQKPLIAVNHMEGHIYSCFVQNSKGNPVREFDFPYLALLISGGHTELVLFKSYFDYEIIGQTVDDAAGEAIDKAARMLGFNYPGGPVLERLAEQAGNLDFHNFPRPMKKSQDLNFSFSGLKTSFYNYTNKMNKNDSVNSPDKLSSSFQEAVFGSILIKTEQAIQTHRIHRLVVGGGVIANKYLRKRLRQLVKPYKGEVLFPPYRYLTGDNASMIGVVASIKASRGMFIKDIHELDRSPRLSLGSG